jgi:hypothetical protein
MSHGRERKEKDCLNCGTIVEGRFCQACGQENIEPRETFWMMIAHFFNDITHFDGKFFTTLKDLVFRPGFLPAEYIRGRRASYLHPVRMYIFTSAVFFLIFFSINDPKDVIQLSDNEPYSMARRDSVIQEVRQELEKDLGNTNLLAQLSLLRDTTRPVRTSDLLPFSDDFIVVGTFGGKFTSRRQYDSVQQSLPADKRDGWLKRWWNKKASGVNEKYMHKRDASFEDFASAVLHQLPYLLFVSLPFFALLLKLLYVRRKKFYYVDHGIFSVHHYIFSFILLLFTFLLNKLKDMTGWSILNFIMFITVLSGGVYLFIAMKKFYKQGFWKTFLKFFLLNIAALLVLIILFAIFSLFAVFQL